jgi:hypothetical protein
MSRIWSPTHRALVLPVQSGAFWPGEPLYEQLVEPLRARVSLYAMTIPWGVVPESTLGLHPELFTGGVVTKAVAREAAVRTRAWFDEFGPRYDPIVFLVRDSSDVVPVWSHAIRGAPGLGERLPAFEAVRLVRVRGAQIRGSALRERLCRMFGVDPQAMRVA